MRLAAGIDVGSGFTKAVIVNEGENGRAPAVLGRGMLKTGVNLELAARSALEMALQQAGMERAQLSYIATTGFGRYSIGFRDLQLTEITSGARGARYLLPQANSVLDIGSQSTRALAINEQGKVRLFKTNDKCAAGSGSFIVRAIKYLQIELEQAGELALRANNPQPISSICAVLAESEIVNHVSAGVGVEDILRGVYDSLADRASLLIKRVGVGGELTFIGGVARQQGMVRALEQRLGVKVNVPEHCEYVCALGAALLGLKRLQMQSPAASDPSPALGATAK